MIMPIILGLLGAVLVVALVAVFFRSRYRRLCALISYVSFLLLLVCGAGTFGMVSTQHRATDELRTQYAELTRYRDVVAACDDEYVRYDFYTKVMDYNHTYDQVAAEQNSIWASYFYTDDLLEGFEPIYFELHGGNYEAAD